MFSSDHLHPFFDPLTSSPVTISPLPYTYAAEYLTKEVDCLKKHAKVWPFTSRIIDSILIFFEDPGHGAATFGQPTYVRLKRHQPTVHSFNFGTL